MTELSTSPLELTPEKPPWFALHVRPNAEKHVAASLRNKGYEEFLPLYYSWRYWSDRQMRLALPLFPGYVFCRVNLNHRLPLLKTPGLVGIVSSGRIPLPLDETEVSAIHSIARVACSLEIEPWSGLAAGDRVRIRAGPLRGLEGVIQQVDGSSRIFVAVTLLQRSVSVKLDCSWVYQITSEKHPFLHSHNASPPAHSQARP